MDDTIVVHKHMTMNPPPVCRECLSVTQPN